jgi:hypothetical protein
MNFLKSFRSVPWASSSSITPMELLKKATTYYHDPFLVTEDEVKDFLRSQGSGSAHAFKRKLFIWSAEGDQFTEVNLDAISPSTFLSSISLADASEAITNRLEMYTELAAVKHYTVQLVSPGQTLEVPFRSGLNSFVVTNKTGGDYFDYVLYIRNGAGWVPLTYNTKLQGAFSHSGDIGALLHYVSYAEHIPESLPFVMGVTGFRKRSLRFFVDQLPAVLLVNPSNETLYLVPCPLDQATIQEATFAGIVVGKKERGMIKYAILPTPVIVNSIDTGELNRQVNEALDAANQSSAALWREAAMTPTVSTPTPTLTSVFRAKSRTKQAELQSLPTGTILPIIEDGLNPSINSSLFVQFGTGLKVSTSFTKTPEGSVSLPFLGLCSGPAGLALGTPYQGVVEGTWETFHKLLENNLPVVHVSSRWIDQVKMSCDILLNSIFIVHSDSTLDKIESALNETNVSAISAMAGPNALVLVKVGKEYYFYRGVRWSNLPVLPVFGTNVTSFVESLSYDKTPWPLLVSRKESSINWRGKYVPLDHFVSEVVDLKFEQLAEASSDIEDVLTQVKVLFSSEELNAFTQRLETSLSALMSKQLQGEREKVDKLLRENKFDMGNKEVQKALAEFRHQSRQANRAISGITTALAGSISLKGASSRAHDLRSLERRRKISSNVENAKNMTLEQKFALLESECTECGVLISKIHSVKFPVLLSAVSEGKFLERMQEASSVPIMKLDPRSPLLDSITLGSLLELSLGRSHFLAGTTQSVAIPSSGTDSSLPFPLFDRFIRLENPAINWLEETNLPNVAMFRILLRSTISEATCSRSFNISPGDRNLGFFLLHGLLSTMESIVQGFSKVPSKTEDWENTSCQMMRGLFGQVFTLLASGNTPLSMAWQLVMKSPNLEVPAGDQWWIYRRVAQCFPYTCWPTAYFFNNLKMLLIRSLRKKVTDPLTDALRKDISALEQKKQKDFVEKRNKELGFLRLATETLFTLREKTTPEVATRLLEHLPEEELPKKSGAKRLARFFTRVQSGTNNWGKEYSAMLQTAIDVHTNRSACFKDVKSHLLKTLSEKTEEKSNVLLQLQKQKDELKSIGDVNRVRVQNQSAIDQEDIHKLKGDAELRRQAWSLASPLNEGEHQSKLNYILTGTRTAVVSAPSTEVKKIEEPVESVLVVELQKVEANFKTITWARNLPSLTFEQLPLPKNDFVPLVNLVNWSPSTVCQVLEVLMMNWNDVLEGEKKALSLLELA